MTKTQHFACAGVLLIGGVMLSGCQSHSQRDTQPHSLVTPVELPPAPPVKTEAPKVVTVTDYKSGANLCQKELASLKLISPKNYTVKKAAYDRLIFNSSQYNGLRGDINLTTQDTMDALYKYKMNILCSTIENDVMQALVRKGENTK